METTLYDLIQSLVLIVFFMVSFIIYAYLYFKYELHALNLDGYKELRLEEKRLNTKRIMEETKLKYELKMLKRRGRN